MNSRPVILFVALLLSAATHAQLQDTTIQQVKIVFEYSDHNFPGEWRNDQINAQGQQIAIEEIPRSKKIIAMALGKYGDQLLEYNLKAVYFLRSMQFFQVGFGGTNSTDRLYLTNNGIPMGYTDRYIEQTFHHEFSSILFRNYSRFIDTAKWKKANDPTFDYNDPESGVGAIRKGRSSQVPDTSLARFGFLTEYSMSSLENDLNTLAQNLFLPDQGFWDIFDMYPGIRTKTQLLIAFYNELDKRYTEKYFRRFSH
jgi:hypothetical protein